MKNLITSVKLNQHSLPHLLLAVSLLGVFIFQITSTVLVSIYPDIDFAKHGISLLVHLPYGWMQTLAFYMFGISLLAVAVIFQYKAPVKINVGAIILALMGLGFFFIGTFPSQLPGTAPGLTGTIHRVATATIVMIFPVACFAMAPVLKSYGFKFLYKYTVSAGILQVLLIFVGGYFLKGLTGFYERILLWNGVIWITVVCLNLLFIEVKQHLPSNVWNRVSSYVTIAGSVYVYCTVLWPLCLLFILG